MGSIFQRGNVLYLRFKWPDGKWHSQATCFGINQTGEAKALLTRLEANLHAGPVTVVNRESTVNEYFKGWIEQRKGRVRNWRSDQSRLKTNFLPTLGEMRLGDVRAQHLVELFSKLRGQEEKLAPRTIHNVYSCVRALFREAQIAGLIDSSPCILTDHHLGQKRDKVSGWREKAKFSQAELEALISDGRVDVDHRVAYALMGLAGLRHGEMAGLRLAAYEPDMKPLGRLTISTSYDTGMTKTGGTRYVPVHPTLAAVLGEWLLRGWGQYMGRAPKADDLVMPLAATARSPAGRMRTPQATLKALHKDLLLLGFPMRRDHDFRRTMISLARSHGADKDILRRVTHKASAEVMEGYTSFDWEVVCREVSKLPVQRQRALKIEVREAAGANDSVTANSANSFDSSEPYTDACYSSCYSEPANMVQTKQSPENHYSFGASLLRGVGDLNP